MKLFILLSAIFISLSIAHTQSITFDDMPPSTHPGGFTSYGIDSIVHARWLVTPDKTAPSQPNSLIQSRQSPRQNFFAVYTYNATVFANGEFSTKLYVSGGKAFQMGGIVFRFQDSSNYYVFHHDVRNDFVELQKMVKGKLSSIAKYNIPVNYTKWYSMSAKFYGPKIDCFFDGKKCISVSDKTFLKEGKAGLWTRGDSRVHFDDIVIAAKK